MKYIILMTVLLTGCATQQPPPLPVEVKVPVAVSCIKAEDIPAKPAYESLLDNDDTPDGTVILHITRYFAKSLPYQNQLEAVIEACK